MTSVFSRLIYWMFAILFLVLGAGQVVHVSLLHKTGASRTIGLPGIPAEPNAWFEPIGVASLIAEGIVVVLYKRVIGCCCCKCG